MGTSLDVARSFVRAVQSRDADAAAELCADDVIVTIPGVPMPFQGRDGVRQMIRMAPSELVQSLREEKGTGAGPAMSRGGIPVRPPSRSALASVCAGSGVST